MERKIEINASQQKVFDCICTPDIWSHCYPQTVQVGGTSKHKPVKPGDIFYEKFLWGGWFYTVFQYAVDVETKNDYNPPKSISFTGKIISANIIVEILAMKNLPLLIKKRTH